MTLKYAVIAIVALVVAVGLYVRFSPVSMSSYHVEDVPAHLAAGLGGNFSVGEGGNAAAQKSALPIEALGLELDNLIAVETPRTTLLAGGLRDGDADRRVASYLTRSAFVGFPDVTTVQLDRVENGTKITMNGRQVYGIEDFGVNEARILDWLQRIQARD